MPNKIRTGVNKRLEKATKNLKKAATKEIKKFEPLEEIGNYKLLSVKQAAFLQSYIKTFDVSQSCNELGIAPKTIKNWWADENSKFKDVIDTIQRMWENKILQDKSLIEHGAFEFLQHCQKKVIEEGDTKYLSTTNNMYKTFLSVVGSINNKDTNTEEQPSINININLGDKSMKQAIVDGDVTQY